MWRNMREILIVFIFLKILIVLCNSKPTRNSDTETLQYVAVIFRHGNRTPLSSMAFPNDAHQNETYYPFGKKELTIEGKRVAYKLGQEIRKRYYRFLKEIYYPPEVEAITSNTSRTQMTLQSVLTAIYQPSAPNLVVPYLMWQPISYKTIPSKDDVLPTLLYLGSQYLDYNCSQIWTNLTTKKDKELQELYDYVKKYSGLPMLNSTDMLNVYDTILVEHEQGFPIPYWAEEIFNNGKLQDAALDYWVDNNEQHLPIISGPLIKRITDDCIRKSRHELPNQITFYSGHDSNIAALLGLFDSYATKFQINYVSHLFIELHKINSDYGFKVFFKNGIGNYAVEQLKFKKCSEDFCTIEDFIESTRQVYDPEVKCE